MREQGDPAVLMVTGRTCTMEDPYSFGDLWCYEAVPDKQFKGGRVAFGSWLLRA